MNPDEARQRIAAERIRVRSARDVARAELGPPARLADVTDGADAAAEVYDREVDLSVLAMLDQELVELEAAEARLRAGTFGRCEICDGPIGDDRLAAVPWAARCVADQVHAETLDESRRADVLHGPAEQVALRNSDLIPDDDRVEEVDLCAEEQAVHLEPT